LNFILHSQYYFASFVPLLLEPGNIMDLFKSKVYSDHYLTIVYFYVSLHAVIAVYMLIVIMDDAEGDVSMFCFSEGKMTEM